MGPRSGMKETTCRACCPIVKKRGEQRTCPLLHTNMFRLAHLLLLLVLTYQLVVQAADVPRESPHEEAPTSRVDGCSKRTLFNIIWGCLSTTIICAWTAIHVNIPPPEGPVKGALRKLELMFWTIVAPEILPAWALNQRLAAKEIRDLYNKERGVFSYLFPMNGLAKQSKVMSKRNAGYGRL